MVLDIRRPWAVAGLSLIVGTKGFVHLSPGAGRGAVGASRRAESPSSPSPCGRRRSSSANDVAVFGACWNCRSDLSSGRTASAGGSLSSVQQSVDGGVMLPPADKAEEYAAFLSESVRQHLDDEWIEQECHKGIGEEVARLYRDAFQKGGDADMTTLVLDVGSAMEKFDMGDAFVGAWDIANLVSDFLMEKMGAETSGCSTKAPVSQSLSSSSSSSPSLSSGGSGGGTFSLTSEKVTQMQADLVSDFSRYRFLADFVESDTDTEWDQANTVMAVYQGYTPEDEDKSKVEEGRPGVRRGWAEAFPGASPPDLRTADGLVEALEADFPDDPDLLDGLEVIVETVYGGEAKRMNQGDPENGIPPEPEYHRRSTVCKWLYLVGFLSDDIKRAPDDPYLLAELISGRARLKKQEK